MRTAKAGLTGLSATEVVAKALLVETRMKGNANFPTPDPPLAEITAQREVCETAILEAASGDHAKVYIKNVELAKLGDLLVREAYHVSTVAAGDVVKIMSSGFEARKLPQPVGPLPAPQEMRAYTGTLEGQVALRWEPVKGVDIYQLSINDADPNDSGKWVLFANSTKASYLATGLAAGRLFWFRVVAIGTAGPSPASDPAKAYAAQIA